MKKIFFCILYLLLVTGTLLAVDENSYVNFAADSIVIAHKFKDNPNAAELWTKEMEAKYPNFVNEDWQSFENDMAKDPLLKKRIEDAILQNIISKGYKAHIVDLGGGASTIEIED